MLREIVNFESIIKFAAETLKMSLAELIAIPEQDSWHYSVSGPAFTPASFVTSALRELGVFHGIEVNAAEFTVKDVYQLDIYDKKFVKPEVCIEADFNLDYCQLFGTYRLDLPGFSTIHPYEHMNERCPNTFENNVRPSNC